MNTAIAWITGNQWAFKYIAIAFWVITLIILKDFVFGVHWIRDFLFPSLVVVFLIWIYLYV